MELKQQTLIDRKMEFAVLAVEATAERMGITPRELRERMQRVALLDTFFEGDEVNILHTQSLQYVAEDIEAALRSWEAAAERTDKDTRGGDA